MKTVDLVEYTGKGATSWGLDLGTRSPGTRGDLLCTGRPVWVGRRLSSAPEVRQAVEEVIEGKWGSFAHWGIFRSQLVKHGA
ncbi:MAG: hypothetical protein ACE5II_03980 [Anaerolineae bacterium]